MKGFSKRNCPMCGSNEVDAQLQLRADDIAGANWTYSPQYSDILGIEKHTMYPIVVCKACGFIYARMLPHPSFMEALYDRTIDLAAAEKVMLSTGDITRRMSYVRVLATLRPATVEASALDFGCGFGKTAQLFSMLGYRTVAFDTSPARLEYVKALDGSLKVVSSQNEIVEESSFDIIAIDNVLEHVPNPHDILQFVTSICKDNAIIFVSVPSYERKRFNYLINEYSMGKLEDMTLNPWEHLNYFGLDHLDTMMGKYNLVPLKAVDRSTPIDIGLRKTTNTKDRCKNAIASAIRLLYYAVSGCALETVENRIYRFRSNPL